jgi:hypothetical protein
MGEWLISDILVLGVFKNIAYVRRRSPTIRGMSRFIPTAKRTGAVSDGGSQLRHSLLGVEIVQLDAVTISRPIPQRVCFCSGCAGFRSEIRN